MAKLKRKKGRRGGVYIIQEGKEIRQEKEVKKDVVKKRVTTS